MGFVRIRLEVAEVKNGRTVADTRRNIAGVEEIEEEVDVEPESD